MDRRETNIKIFEDTRSLYTNNKILQAAVKQSAANQKLYLETEEIPVTDTSRQEKAKVIVSKKRTLEAAMAYPGKKVCVLNFASATNPGGGVTKGSTAQEECLCRCSTLYANLDTEEMREKFYTPHRMMHNPIYNDDCIYTPDVQVFKSDTMQPVLMKQEEWYAVNVITCAAPNLRAIPSNAMNPCAGKKAVKVSEKELKELHLKRGRRIFEIAKAYGNDVLILGAFGCGAFQNPPRVVAMAYKELVEEYRNDFETIEFAVYCSPKDTSNYDVFKRTIVK